MKAQGIAPVASSPRPAGWLAKAALGIVLVCMLVRPFLAETPIRQSALSMAGGVSGTIPSRAGADTRNDLARVVLSWVILLAGLLWAVDAARRDGLEIRFPWLVWPAGGFVVLGLVSALGASDQRAALTAWFEQSAMLGAMLLAAQMLTGRSALVLAGVLLAGLAGALSAKGAYQVLVEHGERVAQFQADRAQQLARFASGEGTPQARLFEARLRDWSPTGFFVLANVYGSLMLLLALGAAGLAGWKLYLARLQRQEAIRSAGRGKWQPRDRNSAGPQAIQLHAPTWSAGITMIVALGAAVMLLASRSKGAIGAGAMAGIAAVGVFVFRGKLAPRWKRAVGVVAAAAVLGGLAVVGFGLTRGYLPSKTMTFRWHYWVGAARVVAQRPALGVGGGNFGSAYLAQRLPQAEEAVKMPHNVVAHALAEYGLAGGGCYLAVLAGVLVLMCRPGPEVRTGAVGGAAGTAWEALGRQGAMALLVVGCVAVAVARATLADLYAVAPVLVLEAMMPAAVLGVSLALSWWARPAGGERDGPAWAWLRIAAGAGLAGFVLHNMVEDSLWLPGAGMVFWVTAGAALGAAPSDRPIRLGQARWAVAALLLIAAAATGWYLVRPVWTATRWTERMVIYFQSGRPALAAEAAVGAAIADPLDAVYAGDAARLLAASCPREDPPTARPCLERAREWALGAHQRDEADFFWARLAARLSFQAAAPDAFRHGWDFPPSAAKGIEEQAMDALADGGDEAVALSDLAWAAWTRGQWAQAAQRLERACVVDPSSFTLRQHLGEAAWLAGDSGRAVAAWREAAQRVPGGADFGEALAMMRLSALKLNPRDARLRIDLARMLLATGRLGAQATGPGGGVGRPGTATLHAAEALGQLDEAARIDQQLSTDSVNRLDLRELAVVRMLRGWAEAVGRP